jgi:two-component system LytT family response regulator
MIKVIVIEDEHENMDGLLRMFREHLPEVEVIAQGRTNADLIRFIEHEDLRPDVLVLDINLPDGHVFQALDQLDTSNFDLIFTTAFNEYAIQAFEKAAIHYLLKPFSKDQLLQAFQRIRARKTQASDNPMQLQMARWLMEQGPNAIGKTCIGSVDGMRFVFMKNIIRLEGDNNYTKFILDDNDRIVASRNIGYFEEYYEKNNFVRIHQSHIVNLNHLRRYIKGEEACVELDNGETIQVARRYKPALIERLRTLSEMT